MLVENENEPARDRSMHPYQQLAVAIIHSALVDFGVVRAAKLSRRGRGRPHKVLELQHSLVIEARLSTLRRQIRAGEFLVERNDELSLLWFRLAGLDVDAMRGRKTHWPYRLKAMREREVVLVQALKKKLRKLLKSAREKRKRGRPAGHTLLGRYLGFREALQRADVPRPDRVGAGLLLWPEDLLRRARGPAAHLEGRTDGPVDRAHGCVDGSLAELPRRGEV